MLTRVAPAVLVALVSTCCSAAPRVVLDPAAQGNRALVFAAGEVARASGGSVAYDASARDGDIAIGHAAPAVRALTGTGTLKLDRPLRAEGFVIRRIGGVVAVSGADDRGDAYGGLWLAERLRLDTAFLTHPDCVREPAVRYRDLVDGRPELLRTPGGGYEGWLQACMRLTMNTIMHAGTSRDEAKLGKAYGMWYMGGVSPFMSVPVDDLIAKHGPDVSEYPGQLCPLKPRVWEAHRQHLRAMLDTYPELDFVRASMGDLPEDFHVYDCHGPACAQQRKAEGLLRACQATWDVVVGERGKTFFVSSWGNPPERYPLNLPVDYTYIMSNLPDRGIVSTVNNTEQDFYLTSPTNPLFGMTGRPQDIYFQVTTEYAGAGFLPVYTGPQIRERVSRAVHTGHAAGVTGRLWEAVGFWTRDVLWTHANLYALYRAAWEPNGDPWEWARDWAALTFGPDGAAQLADALMLSEELARRTFWVPGFSGEKGPAYAITRRNVITDGTHYLRWAKYPHLAAYRRCAMRGKVHASLETLEGALRLSARMMERWHAAKAQMRNPKLAAACDRDFRHFAAVAGVLVPYQRALLHWCHTQDAGITTEERCRSAREAVRWARETRAAWARYQSGFDLYRNGGMTEMLDVYERDCGPLATTTPSIAVTPGGAGHMAVSVLNNASPKGMAATIRATLPQGWTGQRVSAVHVAYGERREVRLRVPTPAGAREGDVTVPVALVAADGRVLESVALRVKVVGATPHPGSAKAEGEAAAPPLLGKERGKGGEVARPTTVCPRTAQPPTIDGVLAPGEWPATRGGWAPCPIRFDASAKENVYAISARWAWDDRCLYVALDVADDAETPMGIRDTIYRGDREHIALDLDGDRRDDYELAFVRFRDAFVAWPVTVDGVFTSTQIAYRAKVAESARGLTVAAGARPDGPGRVIEAAIPWAWLDGYRPSVGKVAGISVQGGDVDAPKGLRAAVQWPSRAQVPDGPYLDWGRVDKPTPFADLVFVR